jgi:hypothetical protein
MALGSFQLLTEMTTWDLPGGKGRPARRADNLTDICEPIVYTKYGSLDFSQPYGPSLPVTRIALPFLPTKKWLKVPIFFIISYTISNQNGTIL